MRRWIAPDAGIVCQIPAPDVYLDEPVAEEYLRPHGRIVVPAAAPRDPELLDDLTGCDQEKVCEGEALAAVS